MIRVTDDYIIDIDEKQYILKKDLHAIDKKGKELYKTLGYYSTLEYALSECSETMTREELESKEYTLKEAIEIIKEIKIMIKNLGID